MRIFVASSMVALLVAAALPSSEATGGQQSFRIITSIDALLVGLSSSCPATNTGLTCTVMRNNLGYDGLSGASTLIPDHVQHSFQCTLTGSLTSVADGTPAGSSMWVGFDLNNDGQSDVKYGGRTSRPGVGTATGELQNRVLNADAVGVATWPLWYANQVQWHGPSTHVVGNVDHQNLIIWLENGADVTIHCLF